MSDHDHTGEDIVRFLLIAVMVGTSILGFCGTRPCPPRSAPGYVWYWPPLQCVGLVGVQ